MCHLGRAIHNFSAKLGGECQIPVVRMLGNLVCQFQSGQSGGCKSRGHVVLIAVGEPANVLPYFLDSEKFVNSSVEVCHHQYFHLFNRDTLSGGDDAGQSV
jgi:hypothetical protein